MLPPIGAERPAILILGSFPSVTSLGEARYYAHPQNAFWWIMANLLGVAQWRSEAHKETALREHRITVWDVLCDVERSGSLDKNMVRGTERVNQFARFFHPDLERIAFNGRTAAKLYKQHVSPWDSFLGNEPLQVTMPSTSPAHAALTRSQKLARWRAGLFD